MNKDNLFGYVDENSEELASKEKNNYEVFGLNRGNLTTLEINRMAGKDKTEGFAVDITVTLDEGKEISTRIYPMGDQIYIDNELAGEENAKYAEVYREGTIQKMAVITHFIKATGVSEEQLKTVLMAKNPQTFESWVETVLSVKPLTTPVPVHLFLEYQWDIKRDNKMTFLQIPKNMKGGRFVCPALPGEWKEETIDGVFCYKNAQGQEHPFTRTSTYMMGNKAVQQFLSTKDESSEIEVEESSDRKKSW